MKKIITAIIIAFVSILGFASESNSTSEYNTCKFSLKYTTTEIYSKVTLPGQLPTEHCVYATVCVNCKQPSDQYVTVYVYRNGKHIGTGIVTIPQGCLESESTEIDVSLVGAEERGYATLKL